MKNEIFFINGSGYSPKNVLIIAELGTGHAGDKAKAGELIDAAAEAGADCIKFQMVYAMEILHPNTGDVSLPGGKVNLFERFRALEQPPSFFAEMKEKAEKRGLIFLCTPFGLRSARELRELGPSCIKIASPELNYTALLKEIATYSLPVLLSTGVSRLGDIEEALEILSSQSPVPSGPSTFAANRGIAGPTPCRICPNNALTGSGAITWRPHSPVCLLHCVTSYPAPEKDYNLRVLGNLASIFGLPVGLSDHSLDPCLVPALGTAMGAAVIEKHFCLSQTDSGLDDPIALTPASFALMVRTVRQAEKAGPEETLEALRREHGVETVESVLGDGVKRLAPSEKENYERTNRSVHALVDIAAGEIIEKEMIASFRTEKNLMPGLPPSWEGRITGLRAKTFIPAGEGINFEDIVGTL